MKLQWRFCKRQKTNITVESLSKYRGDYRSYYGFHCPNCKHLNPRLPHGIVDMIHHSLRCPVCGLYFIRIGNVLVYSYDPMTEEAVRSVIEKRYKR